jgi:small subunit ribosomal protein S20
MRCMRPGAHRVRVEDDNAVANIKSQKKRNITNAKRAARNKAVRSELRTRVKTAVRSAGTEQADTDLRLAIKRLDMAAAKGVIHPNQAARRKSRLMRKLNASAD